MPGDSRELFTEQKQEVPKAREPRRRDPRLCRAQVQSEVNLLSAEGGKAHRLDFRELCRGGSLKERAQRTPQVTAGGLGDHDWQERDGAPGSSLCSRLQVGARTGPRETEGWELARTSGTDSRPR